MANYAYMVRFGISEVKYLALIGLISKMSFASLVINPVSLELSHKQVTEEIVMENQADEVKAFKGKIERWQQEKNDDIYSQTKDVIVIPLVAKIPPKSKQKFRVILKTIPQGKEQASYRLFFNEIPSQTMSKIDSSAITFLLNMTVPVFAVGPNYKPLEKPVWSAELLKKENSLVLSLTNSGHKFMKIRNIATKEIPSFKSGDWQYVLPSAMRSWSISLGKKFASTSLAVSYTAVESFEEIKKSTIVPIASKIVTASGTPKIADSTMSKKP